jgi:hypothetical protein
MVFFLKETQIDTQHQGYKDQEAGKEEDFV